MRPQMSRQHRRAMRPVDVEIIARSAQGESVRVIAKEVGLSPSGVQDRIEKYRTAIDDRRRQIVAQTIESFDEALEAQLAIASDPKHPRCADAFGNLLEIAFPQGGAVVNVTGRGVAPPATDEQRADLEALLALPDDQIDAKIAEMEADFPPLPPD